MHIAIKPSKLRATSPRAYVIRFAFGGGVTAVAGVIAVLAGPSVGGIFLAFPSIAVASLTLVERREGKGAVGADAWGTSLGSLGLVVFAVVVWGCAPRLAAWATLAAASGAWFACSCVLWLLAVWARHRRGRARRLRRRNREGAASASRAQDARSPGNSS